jgi:hypothetical protein
MPLEMPSEGGLYTRDPVTGALTRIDESVPAPAPAPAAVVPAAPADPAPPAAPAASPAAAPVTPANGAG